MLEARDGEEALELWEGRGEGIDAVVTDVVMPGLDGPELARRLAERRAAAPVLYVSGYTQGALAEHQELEGACFLPKPFTPHGLARKLREVLDGVAA